MTGPRRRTSSEERDPVLRRYDPANGRADEGARRGTRAAGDGRGAPDEPNDEGRAPMATPRRLGEMLLLARHEKGVELERAARDTKIRTRYLAALESGDFRDLPGAVYTKGFLRNYAQYLGLDPDVVVAHYRREDGARSRDRVPVVVRPLRAPGAGFHVTPGLFVGAVLSILVLAFVGYIALQFLRYVQPPELAITSPATLVSTVEADRIALAGTATPGATVTVTGLDLSLDTRADDTGRWRLEAPLVHGVNDFVVVALDPATGKRSEELTVTVMVPIAQATDVPGPQLAVDSPEADASLTSGSVTVEGTTTGIAVSVTARYLGPASSGSGATPAPPSAPDPVSFEVAEDGSYSGTIELPPGRWELTITATDAGPGETVLTRQVTVAPPSGLTVVVEIKGGRAWLRIRLDGQLAKETPTTGGVVFEDGTKLTLKAKALVEIRSGLPSVTFVTVNGVSYGALGSGQPGAWAITADEPPRPV